MDETENSFIIECVCTLLRPVLSFCIRHSVKGNELIEACKRTYIELADEQIKKSDQKVSISRLSVITGFDRREVKRIFHEERAPKRPLSLVGRVLVNWQHLKQFTTRRGKPRVLSAEGRSSEFYKLVHSVSADLDPYTVRFELERLGAIEKTPNGLKLVATSFLPTGDLKEGIQMMVSDAVDLMHAIEENLYEQPKELNYHLVTEFDKIADHSIPTVKRWLLNQGELFHKRVRSYLSKYDGDLNPALSGKPTGARVIFGGFSRVVLPEEEHLPALAAGSS